MGRAKVSRYTSFFARPFFFQPPSPRVRATMNTWLENLQNSKLKGGGKERERERYERERERERMRKKERDR